jgi:hypothetical protein
MTSLQRLIPLIQYACARCGRDYVPPRPRHGGAADDLATGARGTARAEARRLEQIREDDEAYRLYAQSLHFCPECRQFVCHECWSGPSGSCRSCAAGPVIHELPLGAAEIAQLPLVAPIPQRRAAALAAEPIALPDPPVSREVVRPPAAPAAAPHAEPPAGSLRDLGARRPPPPERRSEVRGGFPVILTRLALGGLAAIVVTVGAFGVMAMSGAPKGSETVAGDTAPPVEVLDSGTTAGASWPGLSASPGSGAVASGGQSASPGATRTAGPTSKAGSSATAAATATALPTPTPSPSPTVSPLDTPTIACVADPNLADTPYTLTCHVEIGTYLPTDEMHWFLDGADKGAAPWPVAIDGSEVHQVWLVVSRTGTASETSNEVSGAAGTWP